MRHANLTPMSAASHPCVWDCFFGVAGGRGALGEQVSALVLEATWALRGGYYWELLFFAPEKCLEQCSNFAIYIYLWECLFNHRTRKSTGLFGAAHFFRSILLLTGGPPQLVEKGSQRESVHSTWRSFA